MKNALTLLLALWLPWAAVAQGAPCPEYKDILKRLDASFKKSNLDECLDLVEALRACDPSQSDLAGDWTKRIFDAIKKQKQEAIEATQKATASERVAKQARDRALRAQVRADSLANAAQLAARRAYANDLAYKSQIALQRGDRTSAFRLAEFAHRYVDDNNLQVTRALVDALYYNDNPTHSPLPWAYNFEGHLDRVFCASFSPDGRYLATGSADGTAKIWDMTTGKTLHTLTGHKSSIWGVAFSPDGQRLATGSEDFTARIWDVQTATTLLTLEGHRNSIWDISFSADGQHLATASEDRTAIVWDLSQGRAKAVLEGHRYGVHCVAFSPDGQQVATGSLDQTAKIWDLKTERVTQTLKGHQYSINGVAFSPDGQRLATGSSDNTAKIWDLKTGHALMTLEGHSYGVNCVAFSPDGQHLATGSIDHTAKIWDLETGKSTMSLVGHDDGVWNVEFSRDGKYLATASDDYSVKVWGLQTRKTALTLLGHDNSVESVDFSPNGKWLATGSADHTAKVWNWEKGTAAFTLKGHTDGVWCVAFSPDGQHVATGSDDFTAKVWALDSGTAVATLTGHTNSVRGIAFSPDGQQVATASLDNTAKVWDWKNEKAVMTLIGHQNSVRSVAFGPKGRYLVTGSLDNTARIWDLKTGQTTITLTGHNGSVRSVTFSPDGQRLATGSFDNTAKVWDMKTGKVLLTLEGHSNWVMGVCFSPDGQYLATGSADNSAKIWDLQTGKPAVSLEGHTNSVWSVAFSPDGQRLATGSADNSAKVWELSTKGLSHREANRMASLMSYQLAEYGLENLLDQWPYNEDSLIATGNERQIAAFAEMLEQQTVSSTQLRVTGRLYSKAARLYRAAAKINHDSSLLHRLGALYGSWAKDILESYRPDTAKQYIEWACQLGQDQSVCPELWQRFYEKTGGTLPMSRFTNAATLNELQGYADYFFNTGQWAAAQQLYEKAEQQKHAPAHLLRLYEIAQKQGTPFNFDQLLAAKEVSELRYYGDYFFDTYRWKEAQALYEKAEILKHSHSILQNLFDIAQRMGTPFDMDRFLATEDAFELWAHGDYCYENHYWPTAKRLYEKAERKKPSAKVQYRLFILSRAAGEQVDSTPFSATQDPEILGQYATLFIERADTLESAQERTTDYRLALLLREKQLTLDTTRTLRLKAAQEYIYLSMDQLLMADGQGAEKSLRRAIELDPGNLYGQAFLPTALLLQGRSQQAEQVYGAWKGKPFNNQEYPTYREAFLGILEKLETSGVKGIDYEWAKQVLGTRF